MAKKLVNTKQISREEWLGIRKNSIGGSDAGAIIGMSEWGSPITVYADKVGLKEDKPTSEAMRLGSDLESYVAQRFTEETGKKVRNDNYMYQHDVYPFITANIDRVVVGENAGLECKTMNSFKHYDFDNGEVPSVYYCQCQHYMMVMGYDRMYLCVLQFGVGVFVVTIERNEEFILQMLDTEVSFWTNYVEKKVMPSPMTEDDQKTLSELYPNSNEGEIELPGLDAICGSIEEHEKSMKFHEGEIKRLKACIELMLRENGRGYSDGYKVSWLTQERKTVDSKKLKEERPEVYAQFTKVSTSRPLRITKKKGSK